MTGPEHYLEAERLLRNAGECHPDVEAATLTTAQVHATLALVAVQAAGGYTSQPVMTDWYHLLTSPTPEAQP